MKPVLEEMPPKTTPRVEHDPIVWPAEITDEETANQACLLFAISQRRIERAKARIENEKRLIAEEQAQLDELEMRYKAGLRAYTEQNLPHRKNGEYVRKTLNMKDADLKLLAHEDKIDVKDGKAALEWAKEHYPAAVKQDPRLVKEPLLEYFKSTGDQPPGCEFVPAGDSFSVKA